jgi:hypothetical protein
MATRYDAFLSYNRADATDVRTIYEYLVDAGIKVWFDLELPPGSEWLDEMQSGLESSKACLVFFRNDAGQWQKEETKQALRRKAEDPSFRIIPVLLPGTSVSVPPLPPLLKGSTWVDLRSGLFNVSALRKLVQSIHSGATVSIHIAPDAALPDKKLPTGYRADVGKVISLLIGESLYKQRHVAVRELIQNSVDACERRARSSFGVAPAIEVNISSSAGYFQVADNGEGMNADLLSQCFAVIGKSIRDEEDVLERTHADEATRLRLIGKFGVGFISTYILAKRVLLSTSYDGSSQINMEITGIAEPFSYLDSSPLNRPASAIGTTIRVYLKDTYRAGGTQALDILAAVKEYCRHVPWLVVSVDGAPVRLKEDWNITTAGVTEVLRVPYKFELRLGISDAALAFTVSNGGFLVASEPSAIVPSLMPRVIGGEINFLPGVIDVNIARDGLVETESTEGIRRSIGIAIRKLLIRACANPPESIRQVLRDILMAYVEQAFEYEEAEATGSPQDRRRYRLVATRPVTEPPPLTSAEACELLLDVWRIRVKDEEMPLREALTLAKNNGAYCVYWHPRLLPSKEISALFKASLLQRGHLVIADEANRVWFRNEQNFLTDHEAVLKYLSKRYGFELRSVDQPREGDLRGLLVPIKSLSAPTQKIVLEIQRTKHNDVRVGRLRDAPAAFHLAGCDYLNLDNEVVKRMDVSAAGRSSAELKAYILGLLQYELP